MNKINLDKGLSVFKINLNKGLSVFKNNEWVDQYCPYSNYNYNYNYNYKCGVWCPHFQIINCPSYTVIKLCGGTSYYGTLQPKE